MASRKDLKKQKEKISQALIQAALELCANEGYASLSLRSVARKAGIAPTSFYRHFREIDEMGVEISVQAKEVLDLCLIQARGKMTFPAPQQIDSPEHLLKAIECITRPFTKIFLNTVKEHNQLLYLFFQERTGSSEAMRAAISNATEHLTGQLNEDIKHLTDTFGNATADIRLIAESMLTIAESHAMDLLLAPKNTSGKIFEQMIRKLNLLFLGAFTIAQHRKQSE